jgi:hypothetical protein
MRSAHTALSGPMNVVVTLFSRISSTGRALALTIDSDTMRPRIVGSPVSSRSSGSTVATAPATLSMTSGGRGWANFFSSSARNSGSRWA